MSFSTKFRQSGLSREPDYLRIYLKIIKILVYLIILCSLFLKVITYFHKIRFLSLIGAMLAAVLLPSCKSTTQQLGLGMRNGGNPYGQKTRKVKVDSVEVEFRWFQGRPDAYAVVKGQLSSSVAQLAEVKQSRKGSSLIIDIRESTPFGTSAPEGEEKMPKPFTRKIPIEILGLPAGKYPILANGVSGFLEIPENFQDPTMLAQQNAQQYQQMMQQPSPVNWQPAPVPQMPAGMPMMEPMQVNRPPVAQQSPFAINDPNVVGAPTVPTAQPQLAQVAEPLPAGMSAGAVPPGQSAFDLFEQYKDRDEVLPSGMSATVSSGQPSGIYQGSPQPITAGHEMPSATPAPMNTTSAPAGPAIEEFSTLPGSVGSGLNSAQNIYGGEKLPEL